jgi:GDPmannose 4,6-dehydratase
LEETLYLGNLEAKRDWGHARDYVEGMYRILQADEPGISCWRPVRPARSANLSNWRSRKSAAVSSGAARAWMRPESTGNLATRSCVRIDPTYFRPTEVDLLVGHASKTRQKLGWKSKTSVEERCRATYGGTSRCRSA